MPYKSQAQRAYMHANHPKIAKRWDKEFPNQGKLPEHTKKKKPKIQVNNKLKGALGASEFKGKKPTGKIEINVKKHKGDKKELASTVKHELMHVKHPKMTEKEVYKRTRKTKIGPKEQSQLLAKIRHKKLDHAMNGFKKKLKMDPQESLKPGSLISKYNESKKQLAIKGLV